MNSKSFTFNFYCTMPLHQPNEDRTTASVYHFSQEFVGIPSDNSHYAEFSATTLSQCSGTNRMKLCRKGFYSTTVETLCCLTSLFYKYIIPALRNCLVDTLMLPEAPQGSYSSDGLYHVISRTARLQVKRTPMAHLYPFLPCSIKPDLFDTAVVNTHFQASRFCSYARLDFCETVPKLFVASVKLTPSFVAVLNTLPSPLI